ncbi:hypothetical protein BCR44DRAFT_35967 [Catenaria anguillulae PL171]|uniref:Uncharacterized protein n=1 Tax=Catenaria anguillulae PL171 TaxID=765915 RepID=A0A1Y2HF11_9FUNG|nr:hypothetical protein BCR44DRAFT_35967 [Catenaria anguillulae PL171]
MKSSSKVHHPPTQAKATDRGPTTTPSSSSSSSDVDSLLDDLQSRLLAGSSSSAAHAHASDSRQERPDAELVPILRHQFRTLCQHQLASFAQPPKRASPKKAGRQSNDKASSAAPKSYEDRVWQVVFRRIIDPLRAKLNRGDAAKVEESRLELLAALYDAMGYFHAVISALRGYSALNPDTGLVLRFGYLGPAETAQVISLHRCLTYLGDLERYHHQATHFSQPPANDSDDPSPIPFPSTAYSRYLTALALFPSGQACSQLGTVISTYYTLTSRTLLPVTWTSTDDQQLEHLPLLAMYWFTRGIAMRQPSSVCRDNLETLCTQLSKPSFTDRNHPVVLQILLHVLAPTLTLGATPLPADSLSTRTLLTALSSSPAPLIPTHHLTHLFLALLTHLLPKQPPTTDPDLIGHHVRRGLVLVLALATAATCPRALHVLATWAVGQPALVTEVIRTSLASEVADRLDKVVDVRHMARLVADQLPPAKEESDDGDIQEFKWIDEVDRDLCQFACLDDMYLMLDPFKAAATTADGMAAGGGDHARLARLAAILNEHFSSPPSPNMRPPAALADKGPGLRLIQTASGPKLMQELIPNVLVLACDVVSGESVKGSGWRHVSRVVEMEVCRMVVPTYVIEYLDHAKSTSPLARQVVRTLEAVVRQQGGDGLVRIQSHSPSSTATTHRPRTMAVDDDADSDAAFQELRDLQSCVDDILSRDPDDMPNIVVVTSNPALMQAYEAAAVRCVRPSALARFVNEQMEEPRRG